jgi:hypothetical protein
MSLAADADVSKPIAQTSNVSPVEDLAFAACSCRPLADSLASPVSVLVDLRHGPLARSSSRPQAPGGGSSKAGSAHLTCAFAD